MPKVTVILGLCGSGKSFLSRELEERTQARAFEGVASDHDLHKELLSHLRAGGDAIVVVLNETISCSRC